MNTRKLVNRPLRSNITDTCTAHTFKYSYRKINKSRGKYYITLRLRGPMTTMGALTEQLEGSEALGTSTQLHHRIKKKKPNGAVGGRHIRRTATTPVKRLTRTHTYSQGGGLFATLGKYETPRDGGTTGSSRLRNPLPATPGERPLG